VRQISGVRGGVLLDHRRCHTGGYRFRVFGGFEYAVDGVEVVVFMMDEGLEELEEVDRAMDRVGEADVASDIVGQIAQKTVPVLLLCGEVDL